MRGLVFGLVDIEEQTRAGLLCCFFKLSLRG